MRNVPTSKLIAEVAERTGLAKEAVRDVVDAMSEVVVENLVRGVRVEIRGLLSFAVEEREPRTGRNPRTGKPIVIPMARRVRTRIAEAVKRRVAEASPSTGAGILVAAADDPWAEEIRSLLGGIGYELTVAPTFDEARKASRRKVCDLAFVMVGPSIDDATYATLAHRIKLDPATSSLPVVLGRPDLSGLSRPKGVQIMPDATFDSPAAAAELVRAEAERWREEKHYVGRQVTLKSPSDPGSVEKLRDLLEAFYEDALRDETEAYKTLSAFREAIENAAHHGNGSSPKAFLAVALMHDDERIALDVKDEGPGFDHEKALAKIRGSTDAADHARERLVAGGGGGLGLKLMADCTDEVRYADRGTRVVLVKRLHAAGGA